MHLFGRDLDREVAVIAEIGVNHEGDAGKAEAMIALAADAGADAVKLQTYTPARFVSTSNAERFDRVSRFALSEQDHLRLRGRARDLGIALFSSAITDDVVPFVASLGEAVKIASGDLNFRPTIDAAMATGKTVILSTGNGTVDEIDQAVAWCKAACGSGDLRERLILLHCIAAYPAPVEQLNLRSIPFLQERYGLRAGYSNHALDANVVIAAVALGAQVVEVHFTDRREGRTFHDHALSFERDDLAALVVGIRTVREALGSYGRDEVPCEIALRPHMRKGIVAGRDLAAGAVLAADDLGFARPATEFGWDRLDDLVGRRLLAPLRKGEQVTAAAIGLTAER